MKLEETMNGIAIEGLEKYSKYGSESQTVSRFVVYCIESTAEATLCASRNEVSLYLNDRKT